MKTSSTVNARNKISTELSNIWLKILVKPPQKQRKDVDFPEMLYLYKITKGKNVTKKKNSTYFINFLKWCFEVFYTIFLLNSLEIK